tara:strand:+ start:275 stop:658 length:384 start_codon:yes stop_codon:yes gene_type:complete
MKKIYKDIETAKKIYLETEKSKLEKLELSIQDDVKSLYSKYIDLTEEFDTIVAPVSKVRNDVKKWVTDRAKITKEAEALYKKTEKAIEDLGVNRNTFGLLDDLDKIKKDIVEDFAKNLSKSLEKLLV